MAWKQLVKLAFGGALVFAQSKINSRPVTAAPTVVAPAVVHASVDELKSYECARSVASLVSVGEPLGPLFAQGRLVFTSIEAQDLRKILLVNAGYGNFSLTLDGTGVNRMRFQLPTAEKGPAHTFYLSYLHGGALRSRFFEFSEGRAPAGRSDSDFPEVPVRRAENLLQHLNYAIDQTAAATLLAITDGKLPRTDLDRRKIEHCESIPDESPNLAENFRHNLDMLDLIVGTGEVSASSTGGRSPASLR